jgi:hypothetical protein
MERAESNPHSTFGKLAQTHRFSSTASRFSGSFHFLIPVRTTEFRLRTTTKALRASDVDQDFRSGYGRIPLIYCFRLRPCCSEPTTYDCHICDSRKEQGLGEFGVSTLGNGRPVARSRVALAQPQEKRLCSCFQSRVRSRLTGARTCLGPRMSGVGLNYLPW